MSTEELTRTSNPNTRGCDISEEQKQLGCERLTTSHDTNRFIKLCTPQPYAFDGKNYTLRTVK